MALGGTIKWLGTKKSQRKKLIKKEREMKEKEGGRESGKGN